MCPCQGIFDEIIPKDRQAKLDLRDSNLVCWRHFQFHLIFIADNDLTPGTSKSAIKVLSSRLAPHS